MQRKTTLSAKEKKCSKLTYDNPKREKKKLENNAKSTIRRKKRRRTMGIQGNIFHYKREDCVFDEKYDKFEKGTIYSTKD